MTSLKIPYGSELIDLNIEGKLLDPTERRSKVIQNNADAVIRHALQNPVGGTPGLHEIVKNKEQANIVIVIDDQTRNAPTAKMLDCLTEELTGDNLDITLLVACGTHAAPTEADLKRMLGKHCTRFDIKSHDCDAKDMVYLGTTTRGTPVMLNRIYVEADIKVLTGDITLHYYAGFGGGRKSILPGIASRETIQRNHALLVDDRARTANIDGNPVHLDMSEAASMAPPDIVLNTVEDASGNLIEAYAGELNAVFNNGIELARDMFCIETTGSFDALVVSAGGFPKDRNLYQALKAVENSYRALAPGGKFILIAECLDGLGDTEFEVWMNTYTSYDAVEEAIKSNFVLGGHKAYYLRKAMQRVKLSIVCKRNHNTLTRWGITSYESVAEAIKGEIGAGKKEGEQAAIKGKLKIGILRNGLDTLIMN
ncbi:MAG: nickel-dependent lactate racemase [Halobacteriota archaeon]